MFADFAAAVHETVLRRVRPILLRDPQSPVWRLIRFSQAMLLSSIAATAERVRAANNRLHES